VDGIGPNSLNRNKVPTEHLAQKILSTKKVKTRRSLIKVINCCFNLSKHLKKVCISYFSQYVKRIKCIIYAIKINDRTHIFSKTLFKKITQKKTKKNNS